MRFEVFKRDAKIAMLQEVVTGADAAGAQAKLKAKLQQLDEDFALVVASNVGGEFMDSQKMERLRQSGQLTRRRALDDSYRSPTKKLNAKRERPANHCQYLSHYWRTDKAAHRFPRRSEDMIPIDNPWPLAWPFLNSSTTAANCTASA